MLIETAPVLVGRRYLLHERIGKGGMGEVYRATDRLTNQQVALKRVLAPTDLLMTNSISNSTDFRLGLAQEFKILATLRHPHIISVLDYGFDEENQPYFIMELLENAQNILEAGRDMPLPNRVVMLVQILQALAYLHRRGILHRDLKPGNLLVTDGKVKVLDFGLSVSRGDVSDDDAFASGTLSYMAPELIDGRAPSEASDLYAVGTIAYELLTGRHPFHNGNITQMIHDVINTPPDLKRTTLDPRLEQVLEVLLRKKPEERYKSAGDVIKFYAEATNQPDLLEDEATRESFLQAAQFVGRETQMATLHKALVDARHQQGSAWLIGGESGVGKSRLVEEIRIHALVGHIFVLRGQATSERTVPYQLWRAPLRWLALQTELSDLEASVLKDLIPDIENLLERPIPDAPKLDSQATQERLLGVIEDVFLRQKQPVVLILEDLHWVGSTSLRVISRLVRHVEKLPLVIIGSYRDDERPDLPSELPTMKHIKLDRLSEAAIAELSASMLGKEGRETQVVELLHRESEGNVFFLVEVVRALAEKAGGLESIAYMTLPSSIFAGGMQQLIQRRIDHVPESARPLLNMAAVVGRKIDRRLLQAIDRQTDLSRWLTECSNAAVLDVINEEWQFAHDKIREGLLSKLSASEKAALHEKAAKTIEALYPNDPAQTGILAYHWSNTPHTTKAIEYLDKAGEQAVENYANLEAINYLTKAMELDKTPTRPVQLKREDLLGRAYLGTGLLAESRTHLENALKLIGYPLPASKFNMVSRLLGRVVQQVGHHKLGVMRRAQSDDKRERLLHAVRLYEKRTEIAFFYADVLTTAYCSILNLNLSERAGDSPELARSYSNMAVVAGLIRMIGLGDSYCDNALKTLQVADEPLTRARVLSRMGLYACGLGRWEQAESWLTQAMEIANTIGDTRQWGESAAVKSNVLHLMGRYQESQNLCLEIATRSERTGDPQHQMWGSNYQAQSVMRLNQLNEAIDLLTQAEALIRNRVNLLTSKIINTGVMALTHLRLGNLEQARHYAELTSQEISTAPSPSVFSTFEAYACPAEVLVLLLEKNPNDEKLKNAAETAIQQMKHYTKRFPIGKSRAWLWQGILEHLQGENAQETWQKSLAFAREYQMVYDEGLVLYYLGKYGKNPQQLQAAIAIFEKLNAAYDLNLAQQALKGDS